MQSFFYYLLFFKILFSSLIEKWPLFFILSSAECFSSPAQQASLGWQKPLLLQVGRRQSFAPPCRLYCFLQRLCGIRMSMLFLTQQSDYLLLGRSCTLGWSLLHQAAGNSAHLSAVAGFGANIVGLESHWFCLPPTPVHVILLLCYKTILFISSIAISLASSCITINIITRVEQCNNIQCVASQDFYSHMWIPGSTEILIACNRLSGFCPKQSS